MAEGTYVGSWRALDGGDHAVGVAARVVRTVILLIAAALSLGALAESRRAPEICRALVTYPQGFPGPAVVGPERCRP